jgi:signal transduction histidine kinase
VRSERGVGTSFTIEIPIVRVQAPAAADLPLDIAA